MDLKISFAYDFPPDVVWACIGDKRSVGYIVERHPEVRSIEIVQTREENERLYLDLRYTMDLPMAGPVKKAMGDLNAFALELILNTQTQKGTMEATPVRLSDKIKAGGRIYFEQQGDQWVQTFEGDVTVKLFGVGKLVEKFLISTFQKSYATECRLRNEYLHTVHG